MTKVKPVKAWAITAPGEPDFLTYGAWHTRSEAIGRHSPQEWARMKRAGYRCIKVEIRPVEAKS